MSLSQKMRVRPLLISIFLSVGAWASVSHAILNVEAVRLNKRHDPSGGEIAVGFDRKEGNNDVNKLHVGVTGLGHNGHFENLVLAEREFGESNGTRDVNHSMYHLRTNWKYDEATSHEVYAQGEQNQFVRLSFRGVLGAGERWRLVNDDKGAVYCGAGAFWSRETLDPAPNTTDAGTREITRGNIYLSGVLKLEDNVNVTNVTYYQPAFEDGSWVRALETLQVDLKVNTRLSVTLFWNYTYDQRPPQLVKTIDQEYGTNVNFKF